MRHRIKRILLIFCLLFASSFFLQVQAKENNVTGATIDNQQIKKPLYKPFIERYILDELKQLRQEKQMLRTELAEKVAKAKLDASDRAIRYLADTTNNIFYIIAATTAIFVLLGWKSLQDIKKNLESIISKKLSDLTMRYENRLDTIEEKAKLRSDQIITNQQEISNTNLIHSLWLRAGLENNEQVRINIYDQILEINPNDTEALTYKADALLDINEEKWALSLTDQAIEQDNEYALAYWQRACAKAKLEKFDEAVEDIKTAINLAESLKEEIQSESYFDSLKDNHSFQALIRKTESIA